MKKIKMGSNRTWHQNVMNLLLGKNVCGVCLRLDDTLVQWEDLFVFEHDDVNVELSLREIMMSTFNSSILEIVPTTKFCQQCIDAIIKAFFFIHSIRDNYKYIQRRLSEISQQMKWTRYLDETNNLVNPDENSCTDTKKEQETETENVNSNTTDQDKRIHKIYLDSESLKTKLSQDPGMHKFLFTKKKHKETKLPAGITVRKFRKSLDMTNTAPNEALELNLIGNADYDAAIPRMQVTKNELHSNEALIMDLMEKAKTVKNSTHITQSANHLRADSKKDSLTVKLVQKLDANDVDNSDEITDIVPQDLLELKWPEDDIYNGKQCIKIPVKKLNFNEALTVKFIPGQNPNRCQDVDSEIAPHELLELSWNKDPDKVDSENTYLLETEQKHSIDLTKWLQDQGMSIIKKNVLENNKTQTIDAQMICDKERIKIHPQKIINIVVKDNSNNLVNSIILNRNDDVEITAVSEPDKGGSDHLRCALCCLTFDEFEPYNDHYKTHEITEVAKCYKCQTEFPMIEFLSEHLFLIHSENVAYCTICFAILSQDKLANHMSIHHVSKVEMINSPKEKAPTVNLELQLDEYCKKCKQPLDMSTSDPHTCVDRSSKCTECKQACIHEKYLSSYRKQLKENKSSFKCTDCKFTYKTKYDILKHADAVHLKHKPYRCKVCDIGFLLKSSLGKHNNLYHARCNSCRRVFEDRSSLSKHQCKSAAAVDTQCELCGQGFSKSKYKQHKESASVVTDVCAICQRAVPVKCNMVRHMEYIHNLCLKRDTETIIYQCVICERDFKNKPGFIQHSWVHTGVHECHVCVKRFSSKSLYEVHYQMHLSTECDLAKLFICSVCSEQLVDKYAWAHHMQAHTDHEKCQICSKYVEKSALPGHIEGHETLESRFKCPHCPLICTSHSQFEVHVNRFHLQHRPYQCDLCKKSFYSKRLLRQHMNVHNKLKCDFCEREYARKRDLVRHVATHTE